MPLRRRIRALDQVAGLFAMPCQTLNRRLGAEGTTFEMLLAEARYDAARQLLDNADVPIRQLAGFLGYADATAFSRAFRRWSGTPPAEWRASARMPVEE
jgi:AraC-like DNA-binding protein